MSKIDKIKITVYLPPHLHDNLIDQAEHEHRSVTAQVEHILALHYYRINETVKARGEFLKVGYDE